MEQLLEALTGAAPQAVVRRAAEDAVERLWDPDLEQEVRGELEAFRGRAGPVDARLMPVISSALAELGAPARENRVAHALVWRAAAKLLRRANRNFERMAALEAALERAPRTRHRRLTLPIAATATLAAEIGDEEAAVAIAEYAFSMSAARRPSRRQRDRATDRLASALATDERRRSVRAALGELAALSAEDFPLASKALRDLHAEPVPEAPAKDELWVSLVIGLAQEQLEDALTDPNVG